MAHHVTQLVIGGAAVLFLCSGCGFVARDLGYAGLHPGTMRCKGKGAITGTGTLAVGAGAGGAGTNSFTIQADCGDGFEFSSGPTPFAGTVPVSK